MPPVPDPHAVDARVTLEVLSGVPIIEAGDDLAARVIEALERSAMALRTGDVLVVSSKLVSRAEGRFVDLASVQPSEQAEAVAARVGKDPRLVECILRDSTEISREAEGVLIVRHHLGFVSANAAIDGSNACPGDAMTGEWILRMPESPDGSAEAIRRQLEDRFGVSPGVIISDSHGRPFRVGTVGVAVGLAGFPASSDCRGSRDLFGRPLEHTVTALADQVAGAADLVAGQAGEGRGVVLIRGIRWSGNGGSATDLLRDPDTDLYA